MGGFEKVVTFLTHGFIGSQSDNGGPGRVHEGDVEIGVNRRDGCGDGVEVFDFFRRRLFFPHFIGDIKDVFQRAFDIALGILDGRSGVFNRYDDAFGRSGNGLIADDGISFHRPCTGAFFSFTVGCFEKVVTFLTHGFIGRQSGNGGSGRIHEGDGIEGIDFHDWGGNDIKISFQLLQQPLGFA